MSFSQEVIRGTVHAHSDAGNVTMVRYGRSGCNVRGYLVTDKVAGNFKFQYKGDVNTQPPDLRLIEAYIHISIILSLD